METWFRSRLSRYRRIHSRIITDVMQLPVLEYEHHIASLYTKIGAHRRADATAYALRRGFLPTLSSSALSSDPGQNGPPRQDR